MDGSIASAVVLPDQDVESPPPTASSPTGLKRRQSSTYEKDTKRPRIDGNGIHPDRRGSINNGNNNTAPAAPAPKGRERGRERRLFGAALGALSQNSATAALRRRSEIEKRQQAQRKQEDEESEQRKLERLARRKTQRWKEQKEFEMNSMRIRHDTLLAQAHFLQTTTEPRLYYKPWETTQEEDDRIRDQIAEAREIIRQESGEEEPHHKQDSERERGASREGPVDPNADVSLSGKNSNADAPLEPPTANGGPTDGSDPSTNIREQDVDHAEGFANEAVNEERAAEDTPQERLTSHEATADEPSKEAMDENGEEVVEAAEDTVIY
ncbi:hypothetical protein K458DRAFT_423385 [Lentithecium fluviatile CBS 122367]|uniref:Pinin/SDK/MemA protein domain-containing protein n=1 Tax=Lentithecium fluviatile CBS 122367 TaxID=1168545 RepID=A0A6G1IJY6_9PLEO|nr:hypothetical protein K458DRAFT_423385 [Lentithecium fluviatile CBS 122367]